MSSNVPPDHNLGTADAKRASGLTSFDLRTFESLGIPRELLEQAGVIRVDDVEARRILAQPNRPGNLAGILFPYPHPTSQHPVTYRVRRDYPEIENGRAKAKYLATSGDRRRLYFPPTSAHLLQDVTVPVILVEAEKSVLAITAAAQRAGRRVLPIGLGGCWGWRGRIGIVETVTGGRTAEVGVLPDFDKLAWTRDCIISFDSNAATNSAVQSARRALVRELAARGAVVRILDLPCANNINGPDDFIGRFGDLPYFDLVDAAPEAHTFDQIIELNRKHAVVRESGRTIVITEERDPVLNRDVLTRSSFADFRNFYSNRHTGNGKHSRPLGAQWLAHPDRRQYAGVVMLPGEAVPGYLNLWRGFTVEPKAGSWSRLQDHIFEVICAGDVAAYDYVIAWMAAGVQRPSQRAEVAIALRGPRGAGKGHFVRRFGSLFGQHYLQIANPRHLVGHFNAHLQDAVVLFADEAFWAGDKEGESVLKMLITEELLPIERKGRDVVVTKNMLHILIASNSEWVVPAGLDERRFLMLDVVPTHAQDTAYFRALHDEALHGGDGAMLFDLLQFDVSRVDLRTPPPTAALTAQKLLTLSPEERWWFDKLITGNLLPSGEGWPQEVSRDALWDDYVTSLSKLGIQRRRTETELGLFLHRMLGSVRSRRLTSEGGRRWHWTLPSLEECRAAFDRRLGAQTNWLPREESDDVA